MSGIKARMGARMAMALMAALTVGACAAPSAMQFSIQTIDTEGQQVPCVLYIDHKVQYLESTKLLTTPTSINVQFTRNPSGDGFKSVLLGVLALETGADGELVLPDRPERAPFFEETRHVTLDDPARQLFILRLNPRAGMR